MTRPSFSDLFYYVNDVSAMKQFYTDIVGWEEASSGTNERYSFVVYQVTETLFWVVMETGDEIPEIDEWSKGPAFPEGTSFDLNWSIRFHDFDEYKTAVAKIQNNEAILSFTEQPQWGNYWTFHVRDPMGRTVDLYYEPEEKPENPVW